MPSSNLDNSQAVTARDIVSISCMAFYARIFPFNWSDVSHITIRSVLPRIGKDQWNEFDMKDSKVPEEMLLGTAHQFNNVMMSATFNVSVQVNRLSGR